MITKAYNGEGYRAFREWSQHHRHELGLLTPGHWQKLGVKPCPKCGTPAAPEIKWVKCGDTCEIRVHIYCPDELCMYREKHQAATFSLGVMYYPRDIKTRLNNAINRAVKWWNTRWTGENDV